MRKKLSAQNTSGARKPKRDTTGPSETYRAAITKGNGYLVPGPGKHLEESKSALLQRRLVCMDHFRTGFKGLQIAMESPGRVIVVHVHEALQIMGNALAMDASSGGSIGVANEVELVLKGMELVQKKEARGFQQCYVCYIYLEAHIFQMMGRPLLVLQTYEKLANEPSYFAHMPPTARATLYQNMASQYLALGRMKKCVEYLSRSLAEEDDYDVHFLRAQIRLREGMLNTAKRKAAHKDLLAYFKDANFDDAAYYVACFSMACVCSQKDGLTGDVREGLRYYQKGLDAHKRHVYLYGPDADELEKPSMKTVEGMVHSNYAPPGVPAKVRRAKIEEVYQMQMACRNDEDLARAFRASVPGGGDDGKSSFRSMCANCSKTTRDKDASGKYLELKKCKRCKTVVYCCRECQVTHWKAVHKVECKMFVKARARELEKQRVRDEVADAKKGVSVD